MIRKLKTAPDETSYFIQLENAPKISPMPGLETRILTGLHGERMMMVLSATLPGRTVPVHSHPNEQIGIVYAGKAKLRIGDQERVVKKGDFYRIPANIQHTDTCLGDEPFVMLDIFCPIREDFLDALGKKERSPPGDPPVVQGAGLDPDLKA